MPDLKETAQVMVEGAKAILRKSGELVPIVVIIAPHGIEIVGLVWHTAEEKFALYRRIGRRAKEVRATGLITVNDMRFKKFRLPDSVPKEDVEKIARKMYRQGDLEKENAQECIMVAVKKPGPEVYCIMVPYHRVEGAIVFEPEFERPSGEFISDMLPNW